jgi:hypothetical protein
LVPGLYNVLCHGHGNEMRSCCKRGAYSDLCVPLVCVRKSPR